jgi:hypothetical protein
MSLQVQWLSRARADLVGLSDWRVAEAVDAAVDRYARATCADSTSKRRFRLP